MDTRAVSWLLSHPLPGSHTLIKANEVSLIGNRGVSFPGRNNEINVLCQKFRSSEVL
jgi:hypothetical protein